MKKIIKDYLMGMIVGFNSSKYWRLRSKVVDKDNKYPKIILYYYLFIIKRIESKNNSSLGTNIGIGAKFEDTPVLPHHLNGIVISPYAKFGKNVTIFQQVTVGERMGKAPQFGDNVYIGAGAKIIGDIKIGNNVRIGANAVVIRNVPDNADAVGVPAKIKMHEKTGK